MQMTNAELEHQIKRTMRLLNELEAERDRRLAQFVQLDASATQAERDAMSAAFGAVCAASDELATALYVGDSAEVDRIEREVMPALKAEMEAALRAGKAVLL